MITNLQAFNELNFVLKFEDRTGYEDKLVKTDYNEFAFSYALA